VLSRNTSYYVVFSGELPVLYNDYFEGPRPWTILIIRLSCPCQFKESRSFGFNVFYAWELLKLNDIMYADPVK